MATGLGRGRAVLVGAGLAAKRTTGLSAEALSGTISGSGLAARRTGVCRHSAHAPLTTTRNRDVSQPPRRPTMAPHADAIADCVLAAFDALPERRKPRPRPDGLREWVPLAAIVLAKGSLRSQRSFAVP